MKFYLELRYPPETSNGMQWRVRYENTILPEGDAVHFSENQLHVSANDDSHHRVDNENIKRKFAAALVVRDLDFTDLVLYTISNM